MASTGQTQPFLQGPIVTCRRTKAVGLGLLSLLRYCVLLGQLTKETTTGPSAKMVQKSQETPIIFLSIYSLKDKEWWKAFI